MPWLKVIALVAAFATGNFGYAYFADVPNYAVAFDRSIFQAIALAYTARALTKTG